MTRERLIIFSVLLINFSIVTRDFIEDMKDHGVLHVSLEAVPMVLTFITLMYLSREFTKLRTRRFELEIRTGQLQDEAEKWKQKTASFAKGIAQAIDDQLTAWQLTEAEKEIAFLMLKGFSLKEVADIRSTSEHTVKQQTVSIYRKAGLSGRAELSAFFLEDLLSPNPVSK